LTRGRRERFERLRKEAAALHKTACDFAKPFRSDGSLHGSQGNKHSRGPPHCEEDLLHPPTRSDGILDLERVVNRLCHGLSFSQKAGRSDLVHELPRKSANPEQCAALAGLVAPPAAWYSCIVHGNGPPQSDEEKYEHWPNDTDAGDIGLGPGRTTRLAPTGSQFAKSGFRLKVCAS
jgi:hypothetical protein